MTTLLIDIEGTEATSEEIEMLSHPLVAGIILFSRNFENLHQLQSLTQSLRQKIRKPLLITVDQEGGRVQRFRDGLTQLPAMQAFAELIKAPKEQEQLAYLAANQMAREITALDIDLSFAPVLDLGHQCKAIGDRSFHESAETVLRISRQFIQGMHQAGMATTGKHFPGHGAVIADSHLETPIDDRTKKLIFEQDMLPFQQLIAENQLDAIMPAHVIYKQIDNQPASGSPYWLQTILRHQLNFQGTIFSDDLGMKGASFMGDFVDRCEQSFHAGCDLLLLCNEKEGVIQVLDHFKPQESKEHKIQRQYRLQKLFKKQTPNFKQLMQDQNYLQTREKLAQLQQAWLATKA